MLTLKHKQKEKTITSEEVVLRRLKLSNARDEAISRHFPKWIPKPFTRRGWFSAEDPQIFTVIFVCPTFAHWQHWHMNMQDSYLSASAIKLLQNWLLWCTMVTQVYKNSPVHNA